MFFAGIALAEERRPITPEDLWKMKRVGSLEVTRDGSLAAVVVTLPGRPGWNLFELC